MRRSRIAASKAAFLTASMPVLLSGQTVTSWPSRGSSVRMNSRRWASSSTKRIRSRLCAGVVATHDLRIVELGAGYVPINPACCHGQFTDAMASHGTAASCRPRERRERQHAAGSVPRVVSPPSVVAGFDAEARAR